LSSNAKGTGGKVARRKEIFAPLRLMPFALKLSPCVARVIVRGSPIRLRSNY